ATASRGGQRLRAVLVVAEVALAVILLVGAALFLGSFVSVLRIEPGFNPDRVLTAQFTPPVARQPDGQYADRRAGLEEVIARLDRIPGVVAASMVSGGLPFGGATTMSTAQAVDGV